METRKVVLDADFFRKFTDFEPNTKVLEMMLEDLGYLPVMHGYVAEKELRNNIFLKRLVDSGEIEIVRDNEFLSNDDLEDYEEYFRNAYWKVNACRLAEDDDVMEYGYKSAVYDESLGEIRSIYLAKKLGYDIFLSNDGDSKAIAEYINTKKNHIDVYNVAEVLLRCKDEGTRLCYKDVRNILFQLKKDKCKIIDKLYDSYQDE